MLILLTAYTSNSLGFDCHSQKRQWLGSTVIPLLRFIYNTRSSMHKSIPTPYYGICISLMLIHDILSLLVFISIITSYSTSSRAIVTMQTASIHTLTKCTSFRLLPFRHSHFIYSRVKNSRKQKQCKSPLPFHIPSVSAVSYTYSILRDPTLYPSAELICKKKHDWKLLWLRQSTCAALFTIYCVL